MNQKILDAVLKVLQENVHLNYYPKIIDVGEIFVAYDPYAIGTRYNAVRLITAFENEPWRYHPKWVNEETAKMVALIIDKGLEPEENSIWNTGLVILSRASYE